MDAPSRWQALDALFHDALARPPGARAAFLREACPDDADLRDEVRPWWRREQSGAASAFERRVVDTSGAAEAPSPPDPILGLRLGPWRPIDVLGHGGMGTVYLAERADGQSSQQVALKLVPAVGGAGQRFRHRGGHAGPARASAHRAAARCRHDARGLALPGDRGCESTASQSPTPATPAVSTSPAGCASSARSATRCSTRTRRWSSTAT